MTDWTTESTIDPRAPISDSVAGTPSERLLAIYEIGRSLLEQSEPGQVLRTIQNVLVDQLAPDHACVLRVSPGGDFRPISSHELDLDRPEEAWPLSRTALREALESGLALLASDVLEDPHFEGSKSVHRLHIRSVLCVPLGNPIHGLIYADRRSRHTPFTKEDLQFLSAVSLYAGLALDRAQELARTSEALARSDERLELLQNELLRYEIVGKSGNLLDAYNRLRKLAAAEARVLLRGETGTGKELFARAYAASTDRRGKAYVPVSIPALAPNLVESELFGHVKGAFTEASRDKKGYLEVADGGVLFLDEIADIEPNLQVKLLRYLDSGELHRVGDTQPRRVDALVVSATNRDLEKLVREGRFREDLLARLGHPIRIPPLREQSGDIALLVEHFNEACGRGGRRKKFAPETMEVLGRYPWEFNVRQLRQVVEHVVCLVERETILPEDLPESIRRAPVAERRSATGNREWVAGPRPLKDVIEEAERAHIVRTLELTGGNRRRAIKLLGISSDTFYKRLEEFGLHQKKP